jgi:hypothetical protein
MDWYEMSRQSGKRVPPPSPNLTVRMTQEYKRWLDKAAQHCDMTVSAFLDCAAVAYAQQQGFDEPAPRR